MLETETTYKTVYTKALDLLSRREHSSKELKTKLIQRQYPITFIEEALLQLKEGAYQSDERFAEAFIRDCARRGRGPVRIERDLFEKGVDENVVRISLENCGINWFDAIKDVKEKKFGVESPQDFKEQAKQMKFLEYRGFSHEHIASLY
jgi:regulatory protein